MDAPDTITENGRRGSLNRVGGSKKRKAQMNAALQSGIHCFHRPLTRSQGKLFTNTSMFPEEVAQQKPISKADVLCNVSKQIPGLDMGTILASDSKKMMLGGGTSVETMQAESLGENPDWLPTHSNLEENERVSGTRAKGFCAIFMCMEYHPSMTLPIKLANICTFFPYSNFFFFCENLADKIADAGGGSISETGENSGVHMDLQPTEGQSQSNITHCENDCAHDADLTGRMSETSLLDTIYTKYGNITQECNLKSEAFKKTCLLGICGVVQKLQVTSFDDITSDDVAELYSIIKDAENLKLDVKWLHQRLVEIEESMKSRDKLKTMEEAQGAITLKEKNLQKRLAMNKLEIARLEHETEMLREEQAVKKARCEEIKALTKDIKSSYHSCPKYLIDWLL